MKSPTIGLASKLLGSSVLAQIAVMAATIIAARRLAPADFAIYGAITGMAAIVAAVNTLAAESRAAVVDDDSSSALLRTGWTSIFVFTLVFTLAGAVGLAAGSPIGRVLLLGGACAAFVGVQQLLTAVVLRHHLQHLLARARLVQGLSNAALLLTLLLTSLSGYLILTLPWLISLALGVLTIWFGCRSHVRVSRATRGDFALVRREVREQPIANLLGSSVAAMPLLLLPAFGFTAYAGLWALVSRLLTPIVNTVNNTVQPLYYARAAERVRGGEWVELRTLHRRWRRALLLAALPITAGAFVLCYWVLPLLGDQWRVGLGPAAAGTIYFTTLVACLPLSQTLVMTHRVRLALLWTALRCVACLAPFGLISFVGPAPVLLAWACASGLAFAWQLLLNDRSIARHIHIEPPGRSAATNNTTRLIHR